METDQDIVAAHKFSSENRDQLGKSELCGCFHCLRVYKPELITDWTIDNEQEITAICPYCGIDSVLPSTAGYPLTPDFLSKMHNYWFDIR